MGLHVHAVALCLARTRECSSFCLTHLDNLGLEGAALQSADTAG